MRRLVLNVVKFMNDIDLKKLEKEWAAKLSMPRFKDPKWLAAYQIWCNSALSDAARKKQSAATKLMTPGWQDPEIWGDKVFVQELEVIDEKQRRARLLHAPPRDECSYTKGCTCWDCFLKTRQD